MQFHIGRMTEMMFMRGSLLALIAIGLFFVPFPAIADMGPLQVSAQGGVVSPEHPHQSIRLDSEEIIIRLKRSSYTVDAFFYFFNTGGTTTEWTGFPKWSASRTASFPTFMRFEGSVNGRQIKFSEQWDLSGGKRLRNMPRDERMALADKPLKSERQWLVCYVTFPGHTTTTIRVKYETPYDGSRASYIYGTGSLWKDNIGKAVFIVDSTEVGGTEKISTECVDEFRRWYFSRVFRLSPTPVSDNVVRYELRDFKPHPEARFYISLFERRSPPGTPMHPPPPMPVRIKKDHNR